LGISLDRRDPSRVVVISAFEGYAYDAGVRPGDVLDTVNGRPVANLGVAATSDLLRGDPGTPVSISVVRSGYAKPLSFDLTRSRVVIKDVPVAALLGPPADGVAYIRLASFARDAAEECRFALGGLNAATKEAGGTGVTALVLDMRGNPGGLLTSAVEVAEVVLPKGSVVVSTKGRGLGQEPRYVSGAEPAIGSAVKLAVLVNGGTASASEIVAGAVQDLDRGVVVGSRTFGKGLVQNVQTLPYDTALKVSGLLGRLSQDGDAVWSCCGVRLRVRVRQVGCERLHHSAHRLRAIASLVATDGPLPCVCVVLCSWSFLLLTVCFRVSLGVAVLLDVSPVYRR